MNPIRAIKDRLCGAQFDIFIAPPRRIDWLAIPEPYPGAPPLRKELAALNPFKPIDRLWALPERDFKLLTALSGVSAFLATVLAETAIMLVLFACLGK